MITIPFPSDINTNSTGYNHLLKILKQCEECNEKLIVFDFSKVKFLEANLCAILGAIVEILEHKGKIIKLHNFQNQVEIILRKNRFLTNYGYYPVNDYNQTSIPYQKFNPINNEDDQNFQNYIYNDLLMKRDFPSLSPALSKQISLRIFELYENARTHGCCKFVHACGQYFPKKSGRPLNITIVDTGKNFQENVSTYLKKDISASSAIAWAMKLGNTTKTGDKPGGLGLDLIFQFIKKNKGKIQIVSSNGYWKWENEQESEIQLTTGFKGTIANLVFRLDDTSSYILSSEKYTGLNNPF